MEKYFYFLLVTMVVVIAGCKEEDVDYESIRQEERYFNLYLDSNYPEVEPLEEDFYYISYEEGDGITPDTGDYVLINYLAFTIPDESVVDTYVEKWAIDYNIYNSKVLYGPFKYKHGTEIEGLKKGLSLMKEGGIARLIFSSSLGYGKDGSNNIGAYESLMYDVELLEVIKDPVAREINQINDYLAENPGYITVKDPDSDFEMYVYHTESGDSTFIKDEQSAEVFYTGKLLDGRIFDSNKGNSAGLNVVVGNDDVIKGWDLGLPYLRYGSKGRFLIPHQLAYGEEGTVVTNTNKTSIPPFEALLFDVEVSMKVIDEKEKD